MSPKNVMAGSTQQVRFGSDSPAVVYGPNSEEVGAKATVAGWSCDSDEVLVAFDAEPQP
jgi:hypothetical protein